MNFNDPRLPQYFWNQHRVQEDGCWVPTSKANHPTGRHRVYVKALYRYARYNYRHTAHLVHGPLPESLGVSHLCRNKVCCNPAHLTYETNAQNAARERKHQAPLNMPKEEYAKVKARKYYEAHREKIIAKNTAYKKANPEKHRADSKRWYEANKAVRSSMTQPKTK
jgi:HNH endonuclease